jgi:hypothetical protein
MINWRAVPALEKPDRRAVRNLLYAFKGGFDTT